MNEKRSRSHCLIVVLLVLTWTLVACRGPTPMPTAQLVTATPTTIAIRAPIRTPTPTTEGVLELREALAQGLVEAQVRGNGSSSGDSIIVELTRKVPRALELTIPAGTVLRSKDPADQNMVVLAVRGIPIGGGKFRPVSTMRLTSDAPREFLLEAYCLDFDRDNPSGDTGFSVGELASPQVQAVFEALDRMPAAQRTIGAIQTAIWAVTNDVCERELQARFQVGAVDLKAAQNVLEAAGVDPTSTCLFGQRSAELPQGKKALPTEPPKATLAPASPLATPTAGEALDVTVTPGAGCISSVRTEVEHERTPEGVTIITGSLTNEDKQRTIIVSGITVRVGVILGLPLKGHAKIEGNNVLAPGAQVSFSYQIPADVIWRIAEVTSFLEFSTPCIEGDWVLRDWKDTVILRPK